VLALTPVPLQTLGEREFFAELVRWDTGGGVRAAVVASIPLADDGPRQRRISDAVLFVPEGIAVIRVVEVVRQSGVVTALPEGAWTIGPEGKAGEVLQLAGGGSTPLDGLMRAGMDTAVKLREAGLEPGRIARLTVLVGDVKGLVPADGDLGEGDHVAVLDTRSLLLGMARASRYAGVDNPRLWTTADVRAALDALGLQGRSPSVEELNGEGFPYSPYVLRKRELITPAALAETTAGAPAATPATPAATPTPAAGAEPTPAPQPTPAAEPTAALQPTPVAAVTGVRDTVAVDLPQAAPDETDGIGGLFANAERALPSGGAPPVPPPAPRAPASAAAPAPVTPVPASPPPMPPLTASPRTTVFPTSFPTSSAAPPAWAPTAPVSGPPGPPPRARAGSRMVLVVAGVLVLVVLFGVGGLLLLRDGGRGSASGRSGSTPTATAPSGPQVGDVQTIDGVAYRLEAARADSSCVGHGYGEVGDLFAGTDCTGLSRALYSTQLDGRPVVVSVSRIRMADTAGARGLQALADRNGSGNVSDLLREGMRYTGGPDKLSGAEYASAISGSSVTIVESSWVDPANAGSAAEIDVVAGAALVLPVPDFPGG
jgi:hypothetical protein